MFDITEEPEVSIQGPTVGTRAVYEPEEHSVDLTRKVKKKTKKVGNTEIVSVEDDLPYTMSNTPYMESYTETNNILKTAIAQLDQAAIELGEDLQDIRSSKTLRKKYDYIAELQQSRSSIISSKITAARELNNTIKSCHDLELRRTKELKLNESTDDVKTIQDMYNAFVSMPVSQNMQGPYINPLGPTTADFTLPNNNVMATLMGQNPEIGYQNYLNNMTPEQATMLIEENPHINQVVAYDAATGTAQFAIYDSNSKSFLQGLPTRSNEMFMPNMQFDFTNMQAHNNDLNESFDIVMVDNMGQVTNASKVDMSKY